MPKWTSFILVAVLASTIHSANIRVLQPESLRNRYPAVISGKASAGWDKPYGSYISGELQVQENDCSNLSDRSEFLLVRKGKCALEDATQRNPKIVLRSEEDGFTEFESPALLIESSVAETFANTPGVILLNITFDLSPSKYPIWELTVSSESEEIQPYLSVMALFSPEKVDLAINQESVLMKKDSTLVINGVPYDGSVDEVKRALCASFSSPGQECAEFFCAPGCWVDLLENDVCDLQCNNPACYYDNGACSVDSEPTDRNLETDGPATQQNCTYQDPYTSKTYTKSCYNASLPTWATVLIIVLVVSGFPALLLCIYIMYRLYKTQKAQRQEMMSRMTLNRIIYTDPNNFRSPSGRGLLTSEPTLVIEDTMSSVQYFPKQDKFGAPLCALCMVE